MIAVLQRVSSASVSVENNIVGKIQHGLLILLGVYENDELLDVEFLVNKINGFRIFQDENGNMNTSIHEVNGSILVVSQFTLCADWKKGRRPSFIRAAIPAKAEKLYLEFSNLLKTKGLHVENGKFGAMMDVTLTNDGPVTFILDSKD